MGNTSVSNRSSISESRKQIAGEFLHLSAEQYHDAQGRAVIADHNLTRAVDLAYNYGLDTNEIESILGMDSATFEPHEEEVAGVLQGNELGIRIAAQRFS